MRVLAPARLARREVGHQCRRDHEPAGNRQRCEPDALHVGGSPGGMGRGGLRCRGRCERFRDIVLQSYDVSVRPEGAFLPGLSSGVRSIARTRSSGFARSRARTAALTMTFILTYFLVRSK